MRCGRRERSGAMRAVVGLVLVVGVGAWRAGPVGGAGRLAGGLAEGLAEGPGAEGLRTIAIEDELSDSFMQYAMSTILGRALPDARDGMKPVHRRILYGMVELGMGPDAAFRKSARVVGDVLGKYHPHGDSAVYEALVRMAQDFVMSKTLINGHGNFGSVDADPPAAMRYTECKLTSFCMEVLLDDLKFDTVDFMDNFDGTETEPMVLPAKIPLLLVNGAHGIAVGMATSIPPHNLGEVIDGLVALIDNPKLSDDKLFAVIPGPDFPLGGLILGVDGPQQLYKTGNGATAIRAKAMYEKNSRRESIIITEIPYMVNKASLLEKIASLVNEKKIDGISDLRDESDRNGIRIVIELKRDANRDVVLNNLYKKTPLQTSFAGNMVALGNAGKKPVRMTLREALNEFIAFRFHTLRRKTKFQLQKWNDRYHLVQGLQIALKNMDDIIEDSKAAKAVLTSEKFGLTDIQAENILQLRLSRLTSTEESKLIEEGKGLQKDIATAKTLMKEDSKIYDIMKKELSSIKKKYATPRRSVIVEGEDHTLSEEDLIKNDRSIVVITSSGFIKRMPLEDFQSRGRGSRGKTGTSNSDTDEVDQFVSCNDHDTILIITDRGVAYAVKTYQVPVSSRTAKGAPVSQIVPISRDEKITSSIPVSEFRRDEYLLLLTSNGLIKKTPLDAFSSVSSRGLIAISLMEGDALRWARKCTVEDTVLIGSKLGQMLFFPCDDDQLRPTGRNSRGVISMKLRAGDELADVDIVPKDSRGSYHIVAITKSGFGKRVSTEDIKPMNRGNKGILLIKFKKGVEDGLVCLRCVRQDDEILISTVSGTINRQKASAIPIQVRNVPHEKFRKHLRKGRLATGVVVQRLVDQDEVLHVAGVPDEAKEGNEILELSSLDAEAS